MIIVKNLIVILILFSSSLFAKDNLPTPFGIQLGAPISDDIMCGDNLSFKEYKKKYDWYCHGITPPIPNKTPIIPPN